MSVLRHWKILLSLVAIFIVGGITGSLLTARLVKKALAKRANWESWSVATLEQFQKRLQLTPEQVEKLRPVFAQRTEDYKRIRNNMVSDVLKVIQETNEQVEKELTPEQMERFEKLKQELRAQLRERAKSKRTEK